MNVLQVKGSKQKVKATSIATKHLEAKKVIVASCCHIGN
jgi:hypothetical protein